MTDVCKQDCTERCTFAWCGQPAVATWRHAADPKMNVAGMQLNLCQKHDASWAQRYAGTKWERSAA